MSDYNDNKENCPHCGANLQGTPIDKDAQEMFGSTHYSRKIGIYDFDADRVVSWCCPDCGKEWDR